MRGTERLTIGVHDVTKLRRRYSETYHDYFSLPHTVQRIAPSPLFALRA